jgi:hypothetical protein
MALRAGHLAWLAAILLIGTIELLALPRSFGVQLLAIVGVVASVSGVHFEFAHARRKAQQGGAVVPQYFAPGQAAQMPMPPIQVPAQVSVAPGRRSGSRGVQADPKMNFPTPPRFDERGSTAHAQPWLLPAHLSGAGIAADEAQVGDLVVRAASVVGPGHRCEEPAAPRQDAYQLGRAGGGRYLLVAIADGVSSSRRAELGAAVAARRAVELAARQIDAAGPAGAPAIHLSPVDIFGAVAADMRNTAARRRLADTDVCCVLVLAVIDALPGPTGNRGSWVAWVGDVSMWRRTGGRWEFLLGDAKGRAGGVQTSEVHSALPGGAAAVRAEVVPLRAGEAYALVTDGVGDLWSAHPMANDYFARRWATPPPVASYLNDVCFDARGEQDDRTAVVIWTPPVTPQ